MPPTRYSSLAVCLVAVVISVVYTGDLLTLVVPKQISNNRPIPSYFKVGVNEEEARRRWEATLQWRELQDVESLLANPPDNYELIAQHMRTGLISGRDLEGNLFIVDRWGKVDIPLLAARGVRMADLLRAYTFQMEYLWRIAAPEEHEVILLVMDMTGLTWDHMTPFNIELVKQRVRIGCDHYPNRGTALLVVNAPPWAVYGHMMVKPLLTKETNAKIQFLSVEETENGVLRKYIPMEELPREYGGHSTVPLGESRWDREQLRIARQGAKRRVQQQQQQQQHISSEAQSSPAAAGEWWLRWKGPEAASGDGDYWEV